MIDEVDLKILTILQRDARISNAEIARQIEMVPSGVLERIRKLEEKGIIQGYEPKLNKRLLKLGLTAFIFVQATGIYGRMECAQNLAEFPEVLEVHHIAGEDCYLVKVRVNDTESLGEFLREKVSKAGEITSTRSIIVLETLKETMQLPLVQALKK